MKLFIEQFLRKSNGKIAPMKPDTWWEKNNSTHVRDEIFQLTKFLENPVWPQRLWHILNDSLTHATCSNSECNNQVKWNTQTSSYPAYCSKKCSATSATRTEKFHNTCLERYGVLAPAQSERVQTTRVENTIAKYGVDHTSKLESVQCKLRETFVNKYGVDNPLKLPEIRSKITQTNLARYGTTHPLQNLKLLEKRTQTNLTKYGVVSPTQVPAIKQKQEATLFARTGRTNPKYKHIPQPIVNCLHNRPKFVELVSGKYIEDVVCETKLDKSTLYKYISRYNCLSALKRDYRVSSLERAIANFLDENNIKYEQSNRNVIAPQELDIYIPDYNLAIEVCGVYYHSEKMGKGRTYHYTKWQKCRDQGITLLTYFDDEINMSFDVIKSKILYLTKRGNFVKVGARKLKLDTISVEDERDFFNKNHIQGFLHNRNYSIGAYYNNQLVAALCVTRRKQYAEITRFAVSIEYSIPGVFSRLLKKFITDTSYNGVIVSFSDNCHSNGHLYSAAGFRVAEELDPGYYYAKGGGPRENRQRYMKDKIAKKFRVDISGRTEVELMTELGYNRVWDCGKIKWEMLVNFTIS